MGKLKTLIISASPSKDSLTYACALEFCAALTGSKAETLKISNVKILPCTGCLRCSDAGRCPIKDGFLSARKKVMESDIVITASPVYFMGVPSQFKAFIDRHQQFWSRKKKNKNKNGFIILSAGSGSNKTFAGAEQEIRAMHAVNGIKTTGVLKLSCTDSGKAREKALKKAAAKGRMMKRAL